MSEIKINEEDVSNHYKALTDANVDAFEENKIEMDWTSTITARNESKEAFEYSVRLEHYIEKSIDKDKKRFNDISEDLFEADDASKKMINNLLNEQDEE